MAATKFREGNRARWVGTRPAHYGEQVAKHATGSNATTIIHTVTAGKMFFLTIVTAGWRTNGTAVWIGVQVRNDADVLQYYIFDLPCNNIWNGSIAIPLDPPLEIPAGWDVCVVGNGAGNEMTAFVGGWEETG